MMATMEKSTVDHYELLKVTPDVTEKELGKAYKRAALIWHPDKNVNRKEEASRMFDLVRKAYNILSDPVQRATFDQKKRAQIAAKERDEKLTGKRKRLKEELQRRERESEIANAAAKSAKITSNSGLVSRKFGSSTSSSSSSSTTQQNKVDHLRQQSKQQRLARDQLMHNRTEVSQSQVKVKKSTHLQRSGNDQMQSHDNIPSGSVVVVVKWKKKHGVEYSAESLKALLVQECGPVENVLLGKNGKFAVVEFQSNSSVQRAIQCGSKFHLRISEQSSVQDTHQKKIESETLSTHDSTPNSFEAEVLARLRRAA
jgi:curved DNA-binding protein CbpA